MYHSSVCSSAVGVVLENGSLRNLSYTTLLITTEPVDVKNMREMRTNVFLFRVLTLGSRDDDGTKEEGGEEKGKKKVSRKNERACDSFHRN